MAAHWAAAGGHPGAAVTILDAKDPGIPGIVGFVMFLPMYFLGNVLAALTMWRSRYVPRLTGASGERIVAAVRAVAAGDAFFGSDVAAGLLGRLAGGQPRRGRFPELTEREEEVLDLMARGWSNAEITRRLVVSEKTVRNHVFAKLDVPDRAQALVPAREAGLGAGPLPGR